MSLKDFERSGKRGLTRALGRAFRARGAEGRLPDFGDLEAILLIRQQNQLGDMLLSTPAIRAVRQRAPQARIDFIAGLENIEGVRGNRHLNEVLLYEKSRYLRQPAAAKDFLARLRAGRYDLALVMSTVAFSCTSAWLAVLSGARRRAGRAGPDGKGEEIAKDVYHWLLPRPRAGGHQSAVNLDLVTPFGASSRDWRPELFLSAQELHAGEDLLEKAIGPPGDGLRIVVHPGAGKRPNRWPAERFGAVAAALVADGHRVAATAGPQEEELLDALDRGAGWNVPRLAPARVRILAGAFAAADLLLANDTGILHVGAAVGAPVLAFFGPTDPAQWCPAAPRVWTLLAAGGNLTRLSEREGVRAATGLAAHLAGDCALPAGLVQAPEPAS